MDKRTLRLRRETLTDLHGDDLQAVVGAAPELSGTSCPVRDCLDVSAQIRTCGCATGNC